MSSATRSWLASHSPWLESALAFCIALVASLADARGRQEAHADTVRHLLLARDCLEGAGCHLRLSTEGGTSTLGPYHGGVFVHHLFFTQWLGGGIDACRVGLCVLAALGSALLYLVVRQRTGPLVAAVSLGVFMRLGIHTDVLWNPALSTLPSVLLLGGAFCFLRTRNHAYLWLAAAALGIGVATHLALAAGILALLFLAACLPTGQRLSGALVALTIAAGCVQIVSGTAFIDMNWTALSRFASPGWLMLGAAGLAAWWGVARIVAKRLEPFVALLVVAYGLPYVAALLVSRETRYTDVLVPGVVVLGSLAVAGLARLDSASGLRSILDRYRVVLATAIFAFLAVRAAGLFTPFGDEPEREPPAATLADGELLARHGRGAGYVEYSDVFRHLRGGSAAWELLNGLSLAFPAAASARPRAHGLDELMVFALRGSPAELLTTAPGVTMLPAGGGSDLAVVQVRPWLQWDRFDACFLQSGGSECDLETIDFGGADQGEPFLFARRALPGLQAMPDPSTWPARLALRVGLRVSGHDGEHILLVPEIGQDGAGCMGRVEQIRGVDYEGVLPSSRVKLRSGGAARQGTLLLTWYFGTPTCSENAYRHMPPPVTELAAEQLAALDSVLPAREKGSLAVATREPTGLPSSDLAGLMDRPAAEPRTLRPIPREPIVPRWYALAVSWALLAAAVGASVAVARCATTAHLDRR